jgi:chaperonin GroES
MELDVKIKMDKLLSSPNIAEMLDDDSLLTIGERVVNEFLLDKDSRTQWEKRVEEAMKLALQVAETKSFPWPNASNIKFPLVTMAALQFHSRAYPALVPTGNIVKIDSEVDHIQDPAQQAMVMAKNKRVEKHMSYQILTEDDNWESEMDKVLITVPIVGCAFKKTYWDFNEDHPISENVLAKDFVVSYWTKNLKDCTRQSHVLYLSVNDVLSRQRRGIWSDIDLHPVHTILGDDLSLAQDKAQGTYVPNQDPSTPYEFIEQHRWEDLDGDGFKEPYVITVHRESRKVVRIVANYFERSIKKNSQGEILNIKPESYFTKYSFIPSPDGGFYDIGFGILLGPLNESINTIINQLVDAGTMANTAGGFLSRGIKVRGGNYNFAPLEWKHVDSTGEDLAKGIVPLPVREPNQVLFTLLGTLVNYGERIIGATDIMVGENVGQNTPAATSRTMAEQGNKVFAGIFKRIYRALSEEVKKIYRLNQLYLSQEVEYANGNITSEDYQGNPVDLRPAADPHVVTDEQRIVQAEALRQAAMQAPGFNQYKVMHRYLEALKVPNIEEILPNPQGPNAIPPAPNPKLQVEQLKAEERKLSLQVKMKLGMMKLVQEAELNRAKIMKLEAEAVKAMEEAGGVKEGHKIAMLDAQIGAAKAQQDGFLRSIEIMMKASEMEKVDDSNGAGVPGLEGAPDNSRPL